MRVGLGRRKNCGGGTVGFPGKDPIRPWRARAAKGGVDRAMFVLVASSPPTVLQFLGADKNEILTTNLIYHSSTTAQAEPKLG